MKVAEQYLAYDAGCRRCRALAALVEQHSQGTVVAIDLADDATQELLRATLAQPPERRPYLIDADRKAKPPRARTGWTAIGSLARTLGPTRFVRLAVEGRRRGLPLLPPPSRGARAR